MIPLEVKAGTNPKSKSLHSYRERFHPAVVCRTNLLNLRLDGQTLNIPLYMISQIERLAQRSGPRQ